MTGIELTIHNRRISVKKRPDRFGLLLFTRTDTVSSVRFSDCDFTDNKKYEWYESELKPGDYAEIAVKNIEDESSPLSVEACFPPDMQPPDEQVIRDNELGSYDRLRNRLQKKGLIKSDGANASEPEAEKPKIGFELKTQTECIRAALDSGVVTLAFDMIDTGVWLSFSGLDNHTGAHLVWYDRMLRDGDRFGIRLTGMTESTPPIDIRPDPEDDESLLERFRQMERDLEKKRYLK